MEKGIFCHILILQISVYPYEIRIYILFSKLVSQNRRYRCIVISVLQIGTAQFCANENFEFELFFSVKIY